MPLLRSLIALGSGFLLIVLLAGVTTLLTRRLMPEWPGTPPSRAERLFNLLLSSLYGACGGVAVAWLAPVSPLVHSLILALIVLLMSALAAREVRGSATGSYPLLLAVVPSMATLAGGIATTLHR